MLHLRFWLAPNQAGREREDPFHTLLYSVEATEVLVNARRRRTELYFTMIVLFYANGFEINI